MSRSFSYPFHEGVALGQSKSPLSRRAAFGCPCAADVQAETGQKPVSERQKSLGCCKKPGAEPVKGSAPGFCDDRFVCAYSMAMVEVSGSFF